MNEIHLEWIVEEQLVPQVLAAVQNEGGRTLTGPEFFEPSEDELDDFPDSAFEPMMIISVALAASALLKMISDVVLAHKYPGGELFDLRGGKIRRRRISSLDKGVLVIITDKGTTRYSPEKRADAIAMLGNMLEGAPRE